MQGSRRPAAEDIEAWNTMVAPWKTNRPPTLYHPVGCLDCRMTGYVGRIGVYEILLCSPELKKLIAANGELAKVRDLAYREGMKPLRISGAMKVGAGVTTIEEVMKVAPPQQVS